MNKLIPSLLIFIVIFNLGTYASHKVYIIHGYGGTGYELGKIQLALEAENFETEIFRYASLHEDVDSVGIRLFKKIRKDDYDSVSFVTHSMGGIVVRTLYKHIQERKDFPFIHRVVMIAPPNSGSPVADSLQQYDFIRFLVGPNITNLTTDSLTGAPKYPIPTCELGLIIGVTDREKWMKTIPLNGQNDGVVLTESAKMGIEKDIVFIERSHIFLVFDEEVIEHVVCFLRNGEFEKEEQN